ncbi:hypothetical protein DFH06DRAFT_1476651, partial [Mycena polygramma]
MEPEDQTVKYDMTLSFRAESIPHVLLTRRKDEMLIDKRSLPNKLEAFVHPDYHQSCVVGRTDGTYYSGQIRTVLTKWRRDPEFECYTYKLGKQTFRWDVQRNKSSGHSAKLVKCPKSFFAPLHWWFLGPPKPATGAETMAELQVDGIKAVLTLRHEGIRRAGEVM